MHTNCWLPGRLQRIVLNGVASFFVDVFNRVPHGSAPGPLLFIIYINDIYEGLTNRILKYAVDTKLFGAATNLDCQKDEGGSMQNV